MKTVALLTLLLLVLELPHGLTHQYTSPAFLWSPHVARLTKEAVSYRTFSPKELAKSVMSEGGWSNLLCSGQEPQNSVDLALLFIGRELQSSDISGNKHGLVDLLKVSFFKSNSSLAYPYVAASEEKESIESSLISEFAEICGHDTKLNNVAVQDSCAVNGENYEKLADVHSVNEFLVSITERRHDGKANLIVFCHEGNSLKELDQQRPESQVFFGLISSVEQTGSKYAVLYVSDPVRSIQYPSYRPLERFLAEDTFGNDSSYSTRCNQVCQIKSSLLEGILVGIVLLIILVSGLCCMMGIDTPTRFEAPQES